MKWNKIASPRVFRQGEFKGVKCFANKTQRLAFFCMRWVPHVCWSLWKVFSGALHRIVTWLLAFPKELSVFQWVCCTFTYVRSGVRSSRRWKGSNRQGLGGTNMNRRRSQRWAIGVRESRGPRIVQAFVRHGVRSQAYRTGCAASGYLAALRVTESSIYIYIYIYICVRVYTYIYIYIHRERERYTHIVTLLGPEKLSPTASGVVRGILSERLAESTAGSLVEMCLKLFNSLARAGRLSYGSCWFPVYRIWEVGGIRLETSPRVLGPQRPIASLKLLVYAWKTEGCGFVESEISNSTISTVFRQPLTNGVFQQEGLPTNWTCLYGRIVSPSGAMCEKYLSPGTMFYKSYMYSLD